MGMGTARSHWPPGAERAPVRVPPPPPLATLLVLLALCARLPTGESQAHTPQCRIQRCTTDFVSLTSHLTPSVDGFDTEFCKALRAYSACTQRTSKSCRGNLVFHSAMLGISDLMSQRNCSKDGPTSATHPEAPVEPCNYHKRHHGDQPHPTYLFCGLFGDPHLRTFKDHFQTCKVEGAWPLIDNNYLSVQVTNVPVVPGSSATATNKITIIFKPYQECTEQKVYQAVTDDLPAAFTDGTVSGGSGGGDSGESRSLWVTEKWAGRHVEIHASYLGVTVVVRQLGRYLTLAVRVPQELAAAYDQSQDLQLCVNGCPGAERIDRHGHLPLPPLALQQHQQRHAFSLETAMDKCHQQLQVRDIYFHSCVFDLLTTGDANFTHAAHSALQDVEALHPKRERWHIFPRASATSLPLHTLHILLTFIITQLC